MKLRKIKPILPAALGILMLAACASSESTQTVTSVRIGVSLYQGDDTFINNVRSELESVAKEYEQDTGIKVTLDIQDAQNSQSKQNSQVERFLSLGSDVLCINMVDRTTASSIIDQAMDQDVPIVFFNRQPVEEDMNRSDRLYYVGHEPKESATLQAGIVIDRYREDPLSIDLNGDGVVSYVMLEGESGHQDSLIRTEWSVQTLKDAGITLEKIAGGIGNWERTQGSVLMEQWLEKYPGRIELVISNNDDMALGAIEAIERAEAIDINVVGIDGTEPGLQAVYSGRMLGTVACDIRDFAQTVFSLAISEALGEEIDPSIDLIDGKYYNCPQMQIVRED